VIDVLRGQETERIKTWHHDSLSVFGIGADRSEQEWRAILRQVIALGLLTVDHEQFSSLKLTDAARPVLKGGQKVQLRQYQKPVAKPSRAAKGYVESDLSAQEQKDSTACARGAWARRASTTSPPTSSSTTPPCAKSPRPARPRWTTCAASPASARKLPPTATKSSA
jgi:superfamily II DNA helicase RecQ